MTPFERLTQILANLLPVLTIWWLVKILFLFRIKSSRSKYSLVVKWMALFALRAVRVTVSNSRSATCNIELCTRPCRLSKVSTRANNSITANGFVR